MVSPVAPVELSEDLALYQRYVGTTQRWLLLADTGVLQLGGYGRVESLSCVSGELFFALKVTHGADASRALASRRPGSARELLRRALGEFGRRLLEQAVPLLRPVLTAVNPAHGCDEEALRQALKVKLTPYLERLHKNLGGRVAAPPTDDGGSTSEQLHCEYVCVGSVVERLTEALHAALSDERMSPSVVHYSKSVTAAKLLLAHEAAASKIVEAVNSAPADLAAVRNRLAEVAETAKNRIHALCFTSPIQGRAYSCHEMLELAWKLEAGELEPTPRTCGERLGEGDSSGANLPDDFRADGLVRIFEREAATCSDDKPLPSLVEASRLAFAWLTKLQSRLMQALAHAHQASLGAAGRREALAPADAAKRQAADTESIDRAWKGVRELFREALVEADPAQVVGDAAASLAEAVGECVSAIPATFTKNVVAKAEERAGAAGTSARNAKDALSNMEELCKALPKVRAAQRDIRALRDDVAAGRLSSKAAAKFLAAKEKELARGDLKKLLGAMKFLDEVRARPDLDPTLAPPSTRPSPRARPRALSSTPPRPSLPSQRCALGLIIDVSKWRATAADGTPYPPLKPGDEKSAVNFFATHVLPTLGSDAEQAPFHLGLDRALDMQQEVIMRDTVEMDDRHERAKEKLKTVEAIAQSARFSARAARQVAVARARDVLRGWEEEVTKLVLPRRGEKTDTLFRMIATLPSDLRGELIGAMLKAVLAEPSVAAAKEEASPAYTASIAEAYGPVCAMLLRELDSTFEIAAEAVANGESHTCDLCYDLSPDWRSTALRRDEVDGAMSGLCRWSHRVCMAHEGRERDDQPPCRLGALGELQETTRQVRLHEMCLQPLPAFMWLGLPEDATSSDATRAFRKLSRVHHPDRGGDVCAFRLTSLCHGWAAAPRTLRLPGGCGRRAPPLSDRAPSVRRPLDPACAPPPHGPSTPHARSLLKDPAQLKKYVQSRNHREFVLKLDGGGQLANERETNLQRAAAMQESRERAKSKPKPGLLDAKKKGIQSIFDEVRHRPPCTPPPAPQRTQARPPHVRAAPALPLAGPRRGRAAGRGAGPEGAQAEGARGPRLPGAQDADAVGDVDGASHRPPPLAEAPRRPAARDERRVRA